MDGKALHFNGLQGSNSSSFWNIKGFDGSKRKREDRRVSVNEFLHEYGRKVEESVLGPGAGFGVGCGVGLGLGVTGGVGIGGSMWNHLRMAFGVGIGCGVGVGIGYGQGLGIGASLDSIRSRLLPLKKVKSKKTILLPY
ncbi:OLC1v1010698C1 [Oldenlandia corymbosa var. corymbosa]|uniref:OLC1v1010698C1 n=1 Tax=Oldenlandia corymbosa var. corymbosa TaxID=529605 RepID=A0AAV1DS05_OLDCO|nr:OLC1v1010698C1 [Oldenlandia corymbosa var. corymbosa]